MVRSKSFGAQRSLAGALAALLVCGSMPAQEQAAVRPKLNLVIVGGDGAINNIRKRVTREPIVRVEDENHRPLAGAAVTFLLPHDGAGATFADGSRSMTITTDNSGRAAARGLRPNNVPGQYQINITASYQGATGSAVITQTNALAVAAAGAGAAAGISAKTIALIAIAGAAAAAGGAVAATRGGGEPARPAVTPVALNPGTPTVGAPR